MMLRRITATGLVFSVLATAPGAWAQAEAPIVAEARAFMDGYGDDLRAGNREGVAGRYDPGGAWIVHHGDVMAVTHEQVLHRYRTAWSPPAAFEWRDLVFVPSGPDIVSVIGKFDWTPVEGETERLSYHGLLVRSADGFRIRIEHENPIPPDAP